MTSFCKTSIHDRFFIMKIASVSDLRNKFVTLSRTIYEGQSVIIKNRGKVFAILSPPQKKRKHAANKS